MICVAAHWEDHDMVMMVLPMYELSFFGQVIISLGLSDLFELETTLEII